MFLRELLIYRLYERCRVTMQKIIAEPENSFINNGKCDNDYICRTI